MVTDSTTVQWRAYRKPPSLFLMVPSLTPYDLPFPQNGGSICPQHMRMAISLQWVIRSTSCFVLWWGYRGRWIYWRYFRFEQMQDGGRRHLGKISNGDISATGHISPQRWMDGWLGFNSILTTQVAAISCLSKFKVC